MEWISKMELPKTKRALDGRLVVRQRFKVAREFLAPLGKLIHWTYATIKKGKTPTGRAMSKVLNGAIEGEYPHQYVNPAKVLLSDGNLATVDSPLAQRQGGTISITFDPWVHECLGHWDDGVILCAYNTALRIAGINEQPAIRADAQVRMSLPAQLKEETVHLYLLLHSRDKRRFSRSLYIGEV